MNMTGMMSYEQSYFRGPSNMLNSSSSASRSASNRQRRRESAPSNLNSASSQTTATTETPTSALLSVGDKTWDLSNLYPREVSPDRQSSRKQLPLHRRPRRLKSIRRIPSARGEMLTKMDSMLLLATDKQNNNDDVVVEDNLPTPYVDVRESFSSLPATSTSTLTVTSLGDTNDPLLDAASASNLREMILLSRGAERSTVDEPVLLPTHSQHYRDSGEEIPPPQPLQYDTAFSSTPKSSNKGSSSSSSSSSSCSSPRKTSRQVEQKTTSSSSSRQKLKAGATRCLSVFGYDGSSSKKKKATCGSPTTNTTSTTTITTAQHNRTANNINTTTAKPPPSLKSPPPPPPPPTIEIEVSPGHYLPLRGSIETMQAIESGHAITVPCFACGCTLQCVADCLLVICPDCRILSPVQEEDEDDDYGVDHPLGLRHDPTHDNNIIMHASMPNFQYNHVTGQYEIATLPPSSSPSTARRKPRIIRHGVGLGLMCATINHYSSYR